METPKYISITIKDGKIETQTSGNIQLPQLVNVMLSYIIGMFRNAVQTAPEEYRKQVTETLYDLLNYSASSALATFAPDIELRPDLTAEAILKAENDILDEYEPAEVKPEEIAYHALPKD